MLTDFECCSNVSLPTGWLGLVVVEFMVGFLLDGRERGPGARALAEDVARGFASDGIQTHRIELVPTPVHSPRVLHSTSTPDSRLLNEGGIDAAELGPGDLESSAAALSDEVERLVQREQIGLLHAIGVLLPGRVAQMVHQRCGVPYCVTPHAHELAAPDARMRGVIAEARHVVLFDDAARQPFETAFGAAPLRLRVLRLGVDLDIFKPVPRRERGEAAARLLARPELAARLQDIDWARTCVLLALDDGSSGGLEQLLFALPEVLRQQPALVVVAVSAGLESSSTDRLRAALAAGRPDMLHDVLQADEAYQPLVDHIGSLSASGRAQVWWEHAARLEPERRVRFTGPLTHDEFAQLLCLSDLFVMPGLVPHRAAHVLVEALAAGVLSIGTEDAGIVPLAKLIAEEVSAEIASLCVLDGRTGAVREIEAKVGRYVRLRPEIADRLRALAVRKFDGRQTAADLRRLYGEPVRAAALRS